MFLWSFIVADHSLFIEKRPLKNNANNRVSNGPVSLIYFRRFDNIYCKEFVIDIVVAFKFGFTLIVMLL